VFILNSLGYELLLSWLSKKGVNSINYLLEWIEQQSKSLEVNIELIALNKNDVWYYENGLITNRMNSFFSISGIQQFKQGILINEQPIILQNEIGLLGVICTKIDGVLHFLMQAKIEPGNINKVQISPTLQATKSNFMQKHGGNKPAFLDYFIRAKPEQTIVDQIQSEQSSRFFKKRNRNIIVYTEDTIEENSSHKWMTLGQIKALMRYDNIVNMDTRTVMSCIPFALMNFNHNNIKNIEGCFTDPSLFRSLTGIANYRVLSEIFSVFNNLKMFGETEIKLVDLYSLANWEMVNDAFVSKYPFPFEIIFCNITIEGREVRNWTQPLFKSKGIATLGLLCYKEQGVKKFLTKATPEIGCFDIVELGPTVQHEVFDNYVSDTITDLFYQKLLLKEGIIIDVMLSEEGGRFYHEQNRNVIIELNQEEVPYELPSGYFWSDYKTLNTLTQVNNCLNIQLRNLLSLLEL
jgi:dTDP-4-dehydro-6-deoxy-alpha-D-glucopyranose 2,3-dehydratase